MQQYRQVQYGNTHAIARGEPLERAIAEGMTWAVRDFITTMNALGVDPYKAVGSVRTYFTPATEAPGGSHTDPLSQRPLAQSAPLVFDYHIFGWKVSLVFDGTPPTFSQIEEGSRVTGR